MKDKQDKIFLQALQGKTFKRPPFWMMRQAGRYLPEYQAVRARTGGFLNLVYNSEMAAEVTMQPLRRFDMDAAILFSDILVVPHALGLDLKFAEGEGPTLPPIRDVASVPEFHQGRFDETLSPIYETIRQIHRAFNAEDMTDKTLIGFAGAPWTVACYMVEGRGSRDFLHVKGWAYRDPDGFSRLIELLTQATIRYLDGQIRAGAEAVQLFDSWAGVLDDRHFQSWVIEPTITIIEAIRKTHPEIPVIGFPRGAGPKYVDYVAQTGVDGISIDPNIPPEWATALQKKATVQGNLDPVCLLQGGAELDYAIDHILTHLASGPYIFNLGHGIHKDTPISHVERLVARLRG